MKCSCRASSSSLIGGSGAGWEGTALLNHGSVIKFGCIQFTFSVLNFVTPPQKETSLQESSSVAFGVEGKGPIPHRILKRERDSTSSSTVTVSPSPPLDRASIPSDKLKSRRPKVRDDDDDEDEEDEEEDQDEINDETDPDDNDDDNDEMMEDDVGPDTTSDAIEMQESPSVVEQEPESNCCSADTLNSVST